MNLKSEILCVCMAFVAISLFRCGNGSTDGDVGLDGSASSLDGAAGNLSFDSFQQYNLSLINNYRAENGIAPLTLDSQLSTFALAGSTELSQNHVAHQYFNAAGANGTIWSDGFSTNGAAENQGDPNGWPQASQNSTTNEMTQIQEIMAAMYAEGPSGGHYQNIMNPGYTQLGVGLLEVDNVLYLTNDFSYPSN